MTIVLYVALITPLNLTNILNIINVANPDQIL